VRSVAQIAVALALASLAGCDSRDVYLGSDVHAHAPAGSGGGGGGGQAGDGSGGASGTTGGAGTITTSDASTGMGTGMGMDAGVNMGSGGSTVMPVQDSGAMQIVDAGGTPSCPSGYADCDGRTNNGCEANIDNDTAHCGDCMTACPPFGLMSFGSTCSAGKCVLTCEQPFADCDGDPSTGCEGVAPCP
jgi:hypothetical protein